ncbi:hypothetical protein ABTE60_21945, partial [Acinetobacter baumannii]
MGPQKWLSTDNPVVSAARLFSHSMPGGHPASVWCFRPSKKENEPDGMNRPAQCPRWTGEDDAPEGG